jgi:Fe-S-cluster containining protein
MLDNSIAQIDKNTNKYFSGCAGCGAKCCASDMIYLTLLDIDRVSKNFPIVFIINNSKISLNFFFYYGNSEGQKCNYLQENDLCGIYHDRPYACKTYPFSLESNKYSYSLNCPNITKEDFNTEYNLKIDDFKSIDERFISKEFKEHQQFIYNETNNFIQFCIEHSLLTEFKNVYKKNEEYLNFKPSFIDKMYVVSIPKFSILKLKKPQIFKDNNYAYYLKLQLNSMENIQKFS